MTHTFYYIAVKSSVHSSDSTVFGLTDEEVNALSKKYGGSQTAAINGFIIKATPIELINSLSQLGYKVACCSGESELTWTMFRELLAQHNDIIKVKQWLSKRDINAVDKYGYTALHYASRNGHLEMCKFLISHGANVNALTGSGKVSPLHRCVSMGHDNIFDLLCESGASVTLKDDDGKTILHRAVEGGHSNLVEKILKINSSLAREPDKRGCTPKQCTNISPTLLDIFNKFE